MNHVLPEILRGQGLFKKLFQNLGDAVRSHYTGEVQMRINIAEIRTLKIIAGYIISESNVGRIRVTVDQIAELKHHFQENNTPEKHVIFNLRRLLVRIIEVNRITVPTTILKTTPWGKWLMAGGWEPQRQFLLRITEQTKAGESAIKFMIILDASIPARTTGNDLDLDEPTNLMTSH